MPEGPSIVLVKEATAKFEGKTILEATGHANIDMSILIGHKAKFRTWGKHFLISVPGHTVRIHFLMFGSYSIDEQTRASSKIKLCLTFKTGVVYFYSCQTTMFDGTPEDVYDWSADVMNTKWNIAKARKKLKAIPETLICDALLDQDIFAGVGNIIKNEVLYRVKVHPYSIVGKVPPRKLTDIIKEASNYSFDFLKWKRAGVLGKNWQVYAKKKCKDCGGAVTKQYCGKTKRRTFFCEKCQVLYE